MRTFNMRVGSYLKSLEESQNFTFDFLKISDKYFALLDFRTVKIWNNKKQNFEVSMTPRYLKALDCSKSINNRFLALGGSKGKIMIWDWRQNKIVKTLDSRVHKRVCSLAVLKKNYIAGGTEMLGVFVWNISRGIIKFFSIKNL